MPLHVDFETYSELDVTQVGSQAYARHPSTEVLMMSWSFGGDVSLWVPDGPWDYDSIPTTVVQHIAQGCAVCAHNIEFELNIFVHVLGIPITFAQCRDTAVMALIRGYPMSLDGAAVAVNLETRKDSRGKALIRKFCAPRKPTKANPATRIHRWDEPEEWDEFCAYCVQDNVVEQGLWMKLGR